jgi:hypothetical protein
MWQIYIKILSQRINMVKNSLPVDMNSCPVYVSAIPLMYSMYSPVCSGEVLIGAY